MSRRREAIPVAAATSDRLHKVLSVGHAKAVGATCGCGEEAGDSPPALDRGKVYLASRKNPKYDELSSTESPLDYGIVVYEEFGDSKRWHAYFGGTRGQLEAYTNSHDARIVAEIVHADATTDKGLLGLVRAALKRMPDLVDPTRTRMRDMGYRLSGEWPPQPRA